MSCNQTMSGLMRDCAPSMGGIKAVYIADFEWVLSKTVTNGKISAITMATYTEGDEELSRKFLRYYVKPGSSSMTSTGTIDAANGINYISTELALQFVKMEAAKWVEMSALKVNDLAVLVEDANGKFWYLGYDEPVTATATDGATGQAKSDANKYGITLHDDSLEFPFEVDGTVAAGVID